jgi:hypothetical protein
MTMVTVQSITHSEILTTRGVVTFRIVNPWLIKMIVLLI